MDLKDTSKVTISSVISFCATEEWNGMATMQSTGQ